MAIEFKRSAELTIGVELELQLLDPTTNDLSPSAPKIFDIIGTESPYIKPEIFQSMIEINTGICESIADVRRDLITNVTRLYEVCDDIGVELAATGSHPFAQYTDRLLFPSARYSELIDRNRWLAKRLMIFGIHVHIGVRDGNHAMELTNALMPYLPCMLAFSASSPFWQGNHTGLASSRITIFEALPTAGHACTFSSWQEFEDTIDAMRVSGSITSLKDIWWDIRPSPTFGTVEIRICDGMPTLSETLTLVAFIQTLAHYVNRGLANGQSVKPLPYWMIRENKWRAAKDGMDASLVIDESGSVIQMRALFASLLEKLSPIADEIGCGRELNHAHQMLAGKLSYERQLLVYEKEQSYQAVAKALANEFRQDWQSLK